MNASPLRLSLRVKETAPVPGGNNVQSLSASSHLLTLSLLLLKISTKAVARGELPFIAFFLMLKGGLLVVTVA